MAALHTLTDPKVQNLHMWVNGIKIAVVMNQYGILHHLFYQQLRLCRPLRAQRFRKVRKVRHAAHAEVQKVQEELVAVVPRKEVIVVIPRTTELTALNPL